MNRLFEFNRVYAVVVGLISAVTSAVLLDAITKLVGSRLPAFAILLVVIGAASFIIAHFLNTIVDHSIYARRIIVGDEFIEGLWWDVTTIRETGKVVHGVVIHIAYEDGGIIVNGSSYEMSGVKVGTFKSKSCVYKDRVLFCEYEGHSMSYDQPVETGVMQMQFFNPADSYTGFYIDYKGMVRARVCGYLAATAGTSDCKKLLAEKERRQFIMAKMHEASMSRNCQEDLNVK